MGSYTPDNSKNNIPTRWYQSENSYFMNYEKRGKAIIFYYENYDKKGLPIICKKKNIIPLTDQLNNLGFEVVTKVDQKKDEIISFLEIEAKDSTHEKSDCILIIVITHGYSEDKLQAKDTKYDFKHLWKPFVAENCCGLIGKPKIFFVDACRGYKKDKGAPFDLKIIGDQTDGIKTYEIPNHADFLFVYSASKDCLSRGDFDNGPYFIQHLTKELPMATKTDFLSLLTNVSRKTSEVKMAETSEKKTLQVPMIKSTLIRELKFGVKTT